MLEEFVLDKREPLLKVASISYRSGQVSDRIVSIPKY